MTLKYCVIDADSGELLNGEPSQELVEASGRADDGKVLAFRVLPHNCMSWDWGRLPEADERQAKSIGHDVHTVLIEERI